MRQQGADRPALVAIIDDDEAVRRATASLVRSLGLATSTFASAEEFLHWPRWRDSDCVITDMQMPGIDGIELQARLRAAGSRVPVIFITAFPEDHVRKQAIEGGATGFLGKPFDGGAMIACLDAALGALG